MIGEFRSSNVKINESQLHTLKQQLNQIFDFSFPFRTETINILNWARNSHSNWKLDYLLSMNLYGKGRYNESENMLMKIGDESLNPIFYLNRGIILQKKLLIGLDQMNL